MLDCIMQCFMSSDLYNWTVGVTFGCMNHKSLMSYLSILTLPHVVLFYA
uniref:Uncharacterized protein n=1 Tax=Arundo donax TaxID=35708 RepID=A0A0A9BNE5_ARUDO